MIKALNKEALPIILQLFNECIQEQQVPDKINQALLRLLPKTEKRASRPKCGKANSTNRKPNESVRNNNNRKSDESDNRTPTN